MAIEWKKRRGELVIPIGFIIAIFIDGVWIFGNIAMQIGKGMYNEFSST